jgi:hypothetical protein
VCCSCRRPRHQPVLRDLISTHLDRRQRRVSEGLSLACFLWAATHASAAASVAKPLTIVGSVSGMTTSTANVPPLRGVTRYVALAWGCSLSISLICHGSAEGSRSRPSSGLSRRRRNAANSGPVPSTLRRSSTSMSVTRPPDEELGSCRTNWRPQPVSRISLHRSPFELLMPSAGRMTRRDERTEPAEQIAQREHD